MGVGIGVGIALEEGLLGRQIAAPDHIVADHRVFRPGNIGNAGLHRLGKDRIGPAAALIGRAGGRPLPDHRACHACRQHHADHSPPAGPPALAARPAQQSDKQGHRHQAHTEGFHRLGNIAVAPVHVAGLLVFGGNGDHQRRGRKHGQTRQEQKKGGFAVGQHPQRRQHGDHCRCQQHTACHIGPGDLSRAHLAGNHGIEGEPCRHLHDPGAQNGHRVQVGGNPSQVSSLPGQNTGGPQGVHHAGAQVEGQRHRLACQHRDAQAQRRAHPAGVHPEKAEQRHKIDKTDLKGGAGVEHAVGTQHRPALVAGILPAQHTQPRQQHRQQGALHQSAVGIQAVAGGVLPQGEHHGQRAEAQRPHLGVASRFAHQPGRQRNIGVSPGQDVETIPHQVAQKIAGPANLRRGGKGAEPPHLQKELGQNGFPVGRQHLPECVMGGVIVVLQVDDLVVAAQRRTGDDAEIPPPRRQRQQTYRRPEPAGLGPGFPFHTFSRRVYSSGM